MTFGQRFMLLFALFFFFGMGLVAIADWGGKKTAAIVTGSRSVLHYPDDIVARTDVVPCYTGASYEQFLSQKAEEGYRLTIGGDLSDGDRMEIHVRDNGDYLVIVEGPDESGALEGCQVTEGWKFTDAPHAAP